MVFLYFLAPCGSGYQKNRPTAALRKERQCLKPWPGLGFSAYKAIELCVPQVVEYAPRSRYMQRSRTLLWNSTEERALASLQEAIFSDPSQLSKFPVAIEIRRPYYPCVLSYLSFQRHIMSILSFIAC